MSGGHFNYADSRAMDEIFGWFDEEPQNVFEDREISELIFKKKWLKNSGVRVRRIVDEAINRVRTELYETYGVKEEDTNG